MNASVKRFVCNLMHENTYVLNDECGNCVIIDPGCASPEETDLLTSYIASSALQPLAVLLTHGHFDHILSVPQLCARYKIKSWIHAADKQEVARAVGLSGLYGTTIENGFEADCYVEDKDTLTFGAITLQVIQIPGHTYGSVCYYDAARGWLFTGDTLIKSSLCFTNGGYHTLLSMLREQILPLPQDTQLFFGHGESSTLKVEKRDNPFFNKILTDKRNI